MSTWADAQDAVVAALVAAQLDGWSVSDAAGFPGMDMLDARRAGLVWVDDEVTESTFGGVTTAADGSVVPIDESFTVMVNAYRASAGTRSSLRSGFVQLEADLFTALLGATFADGAGRDLVLTGRSYKPGMFDEFTFDGLFTLTFTWRG